MKFQTVVLALAFVSLNGAAGAATAVAVQLGDPADDKSMAMKVDKTSVKAGKVEFDVTNLSKSKIHEMIVVAVKSKGEKLPYDSKNDTVDEMKIKDLGEASDLDPGAKKTLTVDLKPGLYELICNQPGHYHLGMKASFTVTP
jgi:uncharacterized cupredoxin-like copper-binding protein